MRVRLGDGSVVFLFEVVFLSDFLEDFLLFFEDLSFSVVLEDEPVP